MPNIVNTSGVNGNATDFSSLIPVIAVDISGNYTTVGGGGGGTGNVVGPGSAVDNNVAVFDGVTGQLIKDGGVALSGGVFTVANNGGFTSAAAGQVIAVSASSGVTIGAGNGPISIGTTNSQISMGTAQGANNAAFSVNPDTILMTQTSSGEEQYIQMSAGNPIITKGNFRPITSGTNYIGSIAYPYASGNFNNINVGGAAVRGTIYNEIPGGLINGANTTYTLARTPVMPNMALYYNGVYMVPSGLGLAHDYSVVGTGLTMAIAPVSGSTLLCNYQF